MLEDKIFKENKCRPWWQIFKRIKKSNSRCKWFFISRIWRVWI